MRCFGVIVRIYRTKLVGAAELPRKFKFAGDHDYPEELIKVKGSFDSYLLGGLYTYIYKQGHTG